jgi:hypothetical protein
MKVLSRITPFALRDRAHKHMRKNLAPFAASPLFDQQLLKALFRLGAQSHPSKRLGPLRI